MPFQDDLTVNPVNKLIACALLNILSDGKTPPLPTIKWGALHLFLYVTFAPKRKPVCSFFAASVFSRTKKNSPKRSSEAKAWASHPKFRNPSQGLHPLKKHPKFLSKSFRNLVTYELTRWNSASSWVECNHHPGSDRKNRGSFFWGWWWLSIEAVVVPAKGEILNFLPSDSGICEVKCSPIQTPSVSVSSKPECLTKRCVLLKQQKTQSGTQAKLICEFKRTSLKPFSSRNCCDV